MTKRKKKLFRIKSPRLKTARKIPAGSWLLIIFILSLSGCASVPWGEIVNEQESGKTAQLYEQLVKQSRTWSSGFDGELTAQFHSQLENIAYTGFFQMLGPSYLKLVINNPLGQPLVAIASNGRIFQILNTTDRTFKTVTLRSFSLRNGIPQSFMRGHWFAWLTGRPLQENNKIRSIREDPEGRGVWLEIGDRNGSTAPVEYVLLDPSTTRIAERIIIEDDGSLQATIAYENWQPLSGGEQPMHIAVSGLSFGATATFTYSDLRTKQLKPRDFNLPFPEGYSRQFLP